MKNRKGEIILLFAKFLDTEVNFTTWCNGRDELWMRKTQDNGRTWLPAVPAGIQSGHASNDSVLLPDGTIVFASTSTELPEYYFGAVQIYRSHDDGESWEKGALLTADDGNRIREPAICLRPDGRLLLFTRTCPGTAGWGTAGNRSLPSYRAESLDGGLTWSQPKPCGILNNESKLDVISWDKETILMAYNDTPETDWHERSPLTLAYSKDEGLTWQNLITLAPAPWQQVPACHVPRRTGPSQRDLYAPAHRHRASCSGNYGLKPEKTPLCNAEGRHRLSLMCAQGRSISGS